MQLKNPEILEWKEVDGKQEGRGLVWVEQSDPVIVLNPDWFTPKKLWGELRIAQIKIEEGRYGLICIEPPQDNDVRYFDEVIEEKQFLTR